MRWRILAAAIAAAAATPVLAQDDPRFCPTRPDLNASACTIEPGHVVVEMSGLDWQRDDDRDEREDAILAGDALVRTGLGASTELQLGWIAFGHVRTRDKATGSIADVNGIGDVTVAIRQNLRHPDGKGFAVGIQPYVTLPVGRTPVGDGDWAAGVLLPVSYDFTDSLNLATTFEIDAAVDEDGDGRHDAYSAVIGLGYDLSDKVSATGEVFVKRDDDPADPHTEALAAASIAWQPGKRYQLDLLATAGLNRVTPDFRFVTGGAILF